MKKLLGLLAAVGLALILLSPTAEARCWGRGHHWHCRHVWHHVWHRHYYRPHWYAGYYYPRAAYYPYAYYPAAYYRAYYPVCIPIWPLCW